MAKILNKKSYEQGQTLLFVVIAVTISLAVGVAVSTRTISSLRRVSRTDSAARVIAAAEGGIENMLGRTYNQLDGAIDEADCASIGASLELIDSDSSCVYNFNPEPGDGSGDLISSRAVVDVSTFNSNEEYGGYAFNLTPGLLREVYLPSSLYSPNTVQICWEREDSVIYYYSYNPDGEVLKGGLQPNSGWPYWSDYISELFIQSGAASATSPDKSALGYTSCQNINLVDSHHGLRIRVLYNRSKVAIFPTDPSTHPLPVQGYKLESRGEIVTGEGSQEKATVIVHKTYPYAPDIFDYGIYTPGIL
jgi:hypothetical protein